MPATTQDAGKQLRFGLFELDPRSLELSKSGRLMRLQPQPAKVLVYLALRPGDLVPRDELRRHIWGDAFVDAEAGLNACIRDIRAVLGDRAGTPTYVETVPRRGYRFIAPITVVDSTTASAATAVGGKSTSSEPIAEYRTTAASAAVSASPWQRRALALAATVAVTAGGIGLHAAISSQQVRSQQVRLQQVRLQQVRSQQVDPDAHEAVLEARYLLDHGGRGDVARAAIRAQRAVDLEPNWGDAWLVLGDAHLARSAPPHEKMPTAGDAFKRALTHDPTLAAAHRGLASIHLSYDWDLHAARRELDLAEQLGDESSELQQSWAFLHLIAGRLEVSLDHLHRALRLDPVSARIRGDIGWTYALIGEHNQAIEQCRKGLELKPDATWLYGCLVGSYRAQGRRDLAAWAAREEIKAKDKAAAESLTSMPPDKVLRALDQWRLRRMLDARADRYIPSCAVGIRQAQAGHADEAIRQLEIAFDERSSFMPLLEISSSLTSLREDPRFQELAKRLRTEIRREDRRPPS